MHFRLFRYEQVLGLLSTVFGPAFLYLYVIPIFSAVNTRLYQRLLISCMTSDFINLVLKWILNEDRPFWWVHETKLYTSLTRPILYQTERTCETSGGSPSGHMMLASCFLFIIYEELNSVIDRHTLHTQNIMLRILNRISVIALLTFVAASRMFFSAHFLHQCILGCVLGILVAKLMSTERFSEIISQYRKKDWFILGMCMATSVTIIYWAHKLLSGNPMRTVHLAFQHCLNPLFPSPETTVVFSAIRCIGMTFGILLNSPIHKRWVCVIFSAFLVYLTFFIFRITQLDLKKSIIVTILLTAAQAFVILNTPKGYKITVFYSYTFVAYALSQFLFMFVIPKYCTVNDSTKVKAN